MNTLVLDIGGTNVKVWRTGTDEKAKIPSGPDFTPTELAKRLKDVLGEWKCDRVSLGYPGDVRYGRPVAEPFNLGKGWVGFDYSQLVGCPLRIMNDACMQALGSYDGGRMLFLGLGTSVGTALIYDGTIVPLALGHLLVEEGFMLENNLNREALEARGEKAWSRDVATAASVLRGAFKVDYVVLGGGNAKRVAELPEGCVRGENRRAFYGGLRMWDDIRQHDEETYHITRHDLDH